MVEKRIGVIGLGNMGRGIAKNILDTFTGVSLFDTQPEAMQPFQQQGARLSASVAELASQSDVIITCLPTLEAVRSVYLGANGIIMSAAPASIIVDCSTSDPQLTREFGAQCEARNIALLDAPMLRTPTHAWQGTLHLVVGGASDVLDQARSVLESFAEKIYHAGDLGNGHTIKLINNAMTIGTHVVVCEALITAKKLGLDLSVVQEVTQAGMASSKKLGELAPRLINDDHALSFATDVALKDINTFTELAARNDACVSVLDKARELLKLTSASGYGSENLSRTATVLDQLSAGDQSSPTS